MTKKISNKLLLCVFAVLMLLTASSCVDDPVVYSSKDIHTSTYFYTILYDDWINTNEAGHWYCQIKVPAINIGTLNYGGVLVYYKNNNNQWVLLPYSTTFYNQNNQQYAEEIWSGYSLSTLRIDYIYTDPLDMNPIDIDIKVIVMEF